VIVAGCSTPRVSLLDPFLPAPSIARNLCIE
jgi:hypothetical protein